MSIIRSKVAVFVDVENLTHWIKGDGAERLVSDLSSIGQLIVRRAYGKWTNQNLIPLQSTLNRLGFELVHNFHPVSGKNSSDIQLTVDAMEYALHLNDVNWFVLATGDSDFSPLFRRLREMGKEVIGVGPRSPLSESVKTSCSKYIYTDTGENKNKEILRSALDDAVDLVEQVLKNYGGSALCSALKQSMTNIDSAFNEKSLGFDSFTEFLKSVDSIKLNYDSSCKVWKASFQNLKKKQNDKKIDNNDISTEDLYQRFLRKKHWRSIPKTLLTNIYNLILKFDPLTRSEIVEKVLETLHNDITSSEVKKAISIYMKSQLFVLTNENDDRDPEEKLWKLQDREYFIRDVDKALLIRLLISCGENNIEINKKILNDILYGEYSQKEIDEMLSTAYSELNTQNIEQKKD